MNLPRKGRELLNHHTRGKTRPRNVARWLLAMTIAEAEQRFETIAPGMGTAAADLVGADLAAQAARRWRSNRIPRDMVR